MMLIYKWILMLILLTVVLSCGAAKNKQDKPIVKDVDLARYTGTWFEIARLNHSFEKNLVGVTATYTILPNGKIRVLNQGFKYNLNGKHKTAKGIAKVPDASVRGHLKVSFFWPFFADYYIMDLDKVNYSYALIGSNSSKYLWILSRTPKMEQGVLLRLITQAANLGYDTKKLIMVQQAE